MGFFDRLFGGDNTKEVATAPKGWRERWEAEPDEERAAATKEYLEKLGAALGVDGLTIVPRPQDSESDLRGTIRGFPLKITVEWDGDIRDVTFKCADTDLRYIDLEYEPKLPDEQPAVEEWDASERKIILGPGVFVEGSDADKEAADFRKLPADLQQRVIEAIRKRDVLYFRSRTDHFDITMRSSELKEVHDPVKHLADVVAVAVEMHLARGAKPPGAPGAKSNPRQFADGLAAKIAAKVPLSKVVVREDDHRIDIRWTEMGTPVRIALDFEFEDVEIEARAAGVTGDFSLIVDEDVTIEKHSGASDAWDELDHYVFFAKNVFVNGREAKARAEAALVQSIGPQLLAEVVKACEEFTLHIDLEAEVLQTVLSDFEDVTDDGASAIRIAKLLARVAAALPRGQVISTTAAVRCSYCHGLWFRSPSQLTCSHCGARG